VGEWGSEKKGSWEAEKPGKKTETGKKRKIGSWETNRFFESNLPQIFLKSEKILFVGSI
jgi:hypothetical protein